MRTGVRLFFVPLVLSVTLMTVRAATQVFTTITPAGHVGFLTYPGTPNAIVYWEVINTVQNNPTGFNAGGGISGFDGNGNLVLTGLNMENFVAPGFAPYLSDGTYTLYTFTSQADWTACANTVVCVNYQFYTSFVRSGGSWTTAPAVGRPMLFVHGFCETADAWISLAGSISNSVLLNFPSLYPPDSVNPNGGTIYEVYWDGQSVKRWPTGEEFLSTVPKGARFFAINFFAAGAFQGSSIDTTQVAQVSVLNKGGELGAAVRAIAELTHVEDAILIAHSMGGLDARVYLEGQAFSPYSGHLLAYGSDIAKLITIDTPHSGAQTSNWSLCGLALKAAKLEALHRIDYRVEPEPR